MRVIVAPQRSRGGQDDLLTRICAYADWCVDAPRNADARRDPLTAVIVAFYEHLPTHDSVRRDLPGWFGREKLLKHRSAFTRHIGTEAFDALVEELYSPQSRRKPK